MDTTPEEKHPPEEKLLPRGTHHKKPFVMEKGPCLFEHALTKEVLDMQKKRWAYISTICGDTKRLLVKVWVLIKRKPVAVWADAITGTVFLESGECLSSHQRRIKRWGAYENDAQKVSKTVEKAYTAKQWNEGI